MASRFRPLAHLATRTKAQPPVRVDTSPLPAKGLHPWLLPPVTGNEILPYDAPQFVQEIVARALRELHALTAAPATHIASPTSKAIPE